MMEIMMKHLFITREAPEFSVYVVVFKQTIILVRTILAIMPEKNMVEVLYYYTSSQKDATFFMQH